MLPVPYRSQEDPDARRYRNDCGPACVAMLIDWQAQQSGQPIPNLSIDTLSSETSLSVHDDGLPTAALIPLAERYAVALKLSQLTLDIVKTEIDAQRPVLALISYAPLLGRENQADRSGHFLLTIGYDTDNIYVNDPDWWNQGTKTREDGHNWRVPQAQFEQAMAQAPIAYQGLLIVQ